MRGDRDPGLLGIALSAAVPLRIVELRSATDEQRVRIAKDAGSVVASKGDALMFKTEQRGATTEAFNQLALGLAAAAYQPGGVSFAGQHWCVDNHEGCPNR